MSLRCFCSGLIVAFGVITSSAWQRKNSKALQKHQHVTFKHNTDQSKLRTQWTTFCFKNKTQIERSRQMRQSKKMAGQFWKKRLFIKTFFTLVLTIAREMPKNQREKFLARCVS